MKKQVRSNIKHLCLRQNPSDLVLWSEIIMNKIEQLDEFQRAETIAVYWSMPMEVDTRKWVERWSSNKKVLLPVINGDTLLLRLYQGSVELKEAGFGVMEPQQGEIYGINNVDVIIVPGVAFDVNGNRMGHGKGYYDRLLENCMPTLYKVGVCFDFQMLTEVPSEAHDVRMDAVVSEKNTIFVK